MIKRVVQIIVLLLPFLAFLIFSSCADPQPIDDEFKVTKDMNLIEETLFGLQIIPVLPSMTDSFVPPRPLEIDGMPCIPASI